jgi:pSer/pThr/pTyr-binding forkhead associated (FHA) protein
MQSKVNLGEEEHFEEPRKVRRESKAIFNSCPSDGTELPKEDSRLAQSAGHGGQEVRGQGSNKFPEFPSLDDTTFTISVIKGPSKGLVYQLRKACITVGRTGGGADLQFDEPEASDVQCIVAARQKGVRLYDAASGTGIYVNDRRVSTVELRHMSAFRVGSSLLLVSILPNQKEDIG